MPIPSSPEDRQRCPPRRRRELRHHNCDVRSEGPRARPAQIRIPYARNGRVAHPRWSPGRSVRQTTTEFRGAPSLEARCAGCGLPCRTRGAASANRPGRPRERNGPRARVSFFGTSVGPLETPSELNGSPHRLADSSALPDENALRALIPGHDHLREREGLPSSEMLRISACAREQELAFVPRGSTGKASSFALSSLAGSPSPGSASKFSASLLVFDLRACRRCPVVFLPGSPRARAGLPCARETERESSNCSESLWVVRGTERRSIRLFRFSL